MQNPYESPAAENEKLTESRQFPFDIGRAVGRYLQVLAICSVGTMFVDWLVFGEERLDLNFIFLLWGGAALRAHSNIARRWVIGISALLVVFCIGSTVVALLNGTEGLTLRMGRKIEDPTLGDVFVVSVVLSILAGVPLGLLLTPQARFEFAKSNSAEIDRR